MDDITLDNYQPLPRKKTIPRSEWRELRNNSENGGYDVKPGRDDIVKIKRYIKGKYPDHEIMGAFGLSAETLMAIKVDRYDPVDGCYMNTIEYMGRELNATRKTLMKIISCCHELIEVVFKDDEAARKLFIKKHKLKIHEPVPRKNLKA